MNDNELYPDIITVYHTNDSINYSKNVYHNVHFEENKGVNVTHHGTDNASNGLIIIPINDMEEDVIIHEKDLVVNGEIKQRINNDYRVSDLQTEFKVYTVVAVDDNRKIGLKHWEITLK